MEISNQEYSQLVQAHAKPSPLWRDLAWAFGVGGAICTLGQALRNFYQNSLGLDQEQVGTAVSITLIFAAAVLTGLGWFDKLAKRAGREPWCLSPVLPTLSSPPPWSLKARALSPVRQLNSLL